MQCNAVWTLNNILDLEMSCPKDCYHTSETNDLSIFQAVFALKRA